jgi:hypothetical protein
MNTTIALQQADDGTWLEEPCITVTHDEPLTEEQVELFRAAGRAAVEAGIARPATDARLLLERAQLN